MKGLLENILPKKNGQKTSADEQKTGRPQKPVVQQVPREEPDEDPDGIEENPEDSAQVEAIRQELNRRTIYCTHLNNILERFGNDFTNIETKAMYRAIFDLSNRDFEYIEQIQIKENPVTGNVLVSLLERFEEQFNRTEYGMMLKTVEYYFPAYIERIRQGQERARAEMEERAKVDQAREELEKKQAADSQVPRG